jgi:hypothetical protein
MKDCHPSQEQAKYEFLEQLYRSAGRDRADHPFHSTYTGLYREWAAVNEKAASLNEEPAL